MNKSLESYFDNTKQLHLLLAMSLFIIIATIAIPNGFQYTKGIGQGIVIAVLSYILYKNYNETYTLQLIEKDMIEKLKNMKDTKKKDNDKDKDMDLIDIKSNTIASYTLCGFISILLLYFIYSIFF